MLEIHIPAVENHWDDYREEFLSTKEYHLTLEHSLISVSKWESKWKIPFFSTDMSKVSEEALVDYIKCMTITPNVADDAYLLIPESELEKIQQYIEDDHTATFFKDSGKGNTKGGKKEILTSEVIYYYMIALQIPMECQKWHLNRLMTLIKVCNEKNKEQDPKYKNHKLTTKEQNDLALKYDEINERRKRELGTKG